jgi:hypothetical protein
MVMTVGGIMIAAVALTISFVLKAAWLRKFILGGVGLWLMFYTALLLGTSLLSTEKELAIAEPKEFCGFYLDCHMHSAVKAVRRTKTIGDRRAHGEFYVVSIEVFSDAVRAKLSLKKPGATVYDAAGEHYHRDREAEALLGPQPEFNKLIGPEESFIKEVVFDLPADERDPRLDIREGFGIEHMIEAVLIGDEDSIFHKRTYFKLDSEPRAIATGAF